MILISAFNLYKGGSLEIFERLEHVLEVMPNIHVVISKSMRRRDSKHANFTFLRYPVVKFNFLYRLVIEQVYIPTKALVINAELLLMMGNFPAIFWRGKQTVFFHNTLYLSHNGDDSVALKFEKMFFFSCIKVKKPRILVQTSSVKQELIDFFKFPLTIDIVGMPSSKTEARKRTPISKRNCSLFYPAYAFPHKNHYLLAEISLSAISARVDFYLTITEKEFRRLVGNRPFNSDCFHFLGNLDSAEVFQQFHKCDGLVFLSSTESLGIPLLEAVEHKISVVAPNLKYVSAAIANFYAFDTQDVRSLNASICLLVDDFFNLDHKIATSSILADPLVFYRKITIL
jgi:glycosyltransferase involved in cell wall biosynthesis